MKVNEYNYIKELRNRNEKALDYVIDNYGWIIKSVVGKHLYGIQSVQGECINDVLLGIWNNINSFDESKSDFKNWVAGICKFKCIDYKRKYLKDLQHENIDDLNISDDGTEMKNLENELSNEMESLLKCLKEKDRDLLYKLYVDGMDIDEISTECGMKKEVIYNRLSRAKKKIKDIFNINNRRGVKYEK
ncbi:sigma-70 family RNA polymerase sigma factor [Clostridium saccharobutylicum]|uniref:RNA polymerase, sigma-24 subunit, ECF subfamily n=1 Tax=Clostridium saccharobutylicum DSM 13864 TaxID=1345695 RepID=U5MQU2_CLOSA|nr:sigma-70 family RNA polymerase sigma factor [Clostridium saccharobutylicum]AGX42945.1 RNA polymerase, sigma-24 subunit, ECF subfamily [Clostridium saccharobutylicum DSM 13864]AQR90238.1 RNA polymerase factor sigma-70 [Clostridium saccharobutylicum]AQS00144.1 RNA polymerase factor sigma-70 [Clostridium saccharobutylicum]AQS09943.1 RNA polymerase factor sigma-70 [Clostridium saccharobutylicum]AQS14127.1 RNA polymerase factor sigma-70 [Clostridium saccharobutylicum]